MNGHVEGAEAIRFASLAAKAVGHKCVLRRAPGGQFELVRTGWGMSRICRSLDEVAGVLQLMGAEVRGQGSAP